MSAESGITGINDVCLSFIANHLNFINAAFLQNIKDADKSVILCFIISQNAVFTIGFEMLAKQRLIYAYAVYRYRVTRYNYV